MYNKDRPKVKGLQIDRENAPFCIIPLKTSQGRIKFGY